MTDPADPASQPPLAGLVLCGGGSRRMGTDKGELSFDGVPLIERVVSRLAGAADPILLAAGMPGRFARLGLREVEDRPGGIGPLGGLIAGLEASPHELVAVVAVDHPFVNAEVLSLLARLRQAEDAIVPVTSSGTQPLHAVYARAAVPHLLRTARDHRYALRAALDGLTIRFVPRDEWVTADPTGRFAMNVNRPEDLSGLGYPG